MNAKYSYSAIAFLISLLLSSGCKTTLNGVETPYTPVVRVIQTPDAVWGRLLGTTTTDMPVPVEVFTRDDIDRLLILEVKPQSGSPIFATLKVLPSNEGTSADVYSFYRVPTGGLQGLEQVKIAEMFQAAMLERLK